MTNEELRELDAEVAEKVMEWKGPIHWANDEEGYDPYLYPPNNALAEAGRIVGDRNFDCIVPRYSADIAAAWQVVEKLRADGWLCQLWHEPWKYGRGDSWECKFVRAEAEVDSVMYCADPNRPAAAPVAICRAALETVKRGSRA